MKRGSIQNWTDLDKCKNLLFFAQLVNELLFDYSIPSNRISTLNSHYLCFDALNTVDSIDNQGVPEGTLKPIMEELFTSLKKDVVFTLNGEKPLKYFVKYQNGYYRNAISTSELNYEESKKVIQSLESKYFANDWYINNLKNKIYEIIVRNIETDQQDLFRLTKSLLTELVNYGYSIKYIYEQTQRCFYRSQSHIDTPEQINKFFNAFKFQKNEYSVLFIIDKNQQKLIQSIDEIECTDVFKAKTTIQLEKTFLKKEHDERYIILKVNDYDSYAAAENIKMMLNNNAAFYRMCDHNYVFNINNARCGVYDENDFFTLVEEDKSAVQRAKTLSKEQINDYMKNVNKTFVSAIKRKQFNEVLALWNAASFHSLSLDSTSEKNQLLDLWAIFETILDISNKHTSDRIQQVCIYLVPILKRKYIYSLFTQLANDIKNYSLEKYNLITKKNNKEFEIVKSICEFVILEEHKDKREEFLSSLTDFPLLKERIEYYNQMLSVPLNIYHFVEKHSEHVKWQIMRIYRNRNLIIHNGETMPYLKLLIENLHSYVDDFLNYTILSLSNGNSLDSMCQELFSNECEWIEVFSNKKTIMSADLIKNLLMQ